jgi:VWFA-related protein
MPPALRRLVALTFMAAAVAATPVLRAQDDGVAIVSPEAGGYMSGRVTFQARVPLATDAVNVTFFVDGREVCVITRRPYDCDWNAGRIIRERQVRMVVTLKDGRRIVRNVRTQGLDYAANTTVQAVQVTVSVLQGGRFISSLPQSAFTIHEDGRPQTVNSFIAEDGPLELVVAVDISGSMKEALPTVKKAVQTFLSAVPPNNYVTVLAFNEEVFEVSRRAIGAAERSKAIDQLEAWGSTVLHDALMRGLDVLDEQAGRKALVVFTDGEDRGSNSGLAEVERRLEGSDATLYMIGQGRGTSAESLKRLMERLSEPTGGRALFTDRLDELSSAFQSLLEELRHQYLLGYQSSNSAKDGTWREIKVEVAGPGRVRARRGYRAVLER